jgi:protein TonB
MLARSTGRKKVNRKLFTIAVAAMLLGQAAIAGTAEQEAPAPAAAPATAGASGNTAGDHPASIDEDRPQPAPRFSAAMKNNAGTGTVVVMVQVGADDKAKSFHVMMSSGSKALDDEAIRTAKGWSYKSAVKNGVPADGYVQVPISFNK